jgi:pilus assembly protein CpaE
MEMLSFADAGIVDLLREPFSHEELETIAYDALHRGHSVADQNILALMPAKAGGGCSTVALNVAAALAEHHSKKVLLVESDRRSGILSIMLDLKNRSGLSEALQQAGELTPVEWQQHTVWVSGIHLLPANPSRRCPLPTWAQYFQLLRFVQQRYDYVFVDLPEVVNEATAEVVKSARSICIVCTPEVPSLKMAGQRCAELEACKIPGDRIHIVVNRWERGGLSIDHVEDVLGRPVFATLPNDYKQVKSAILESRLVAAHSRFGRACVGLAHKLSGLPEAPQAESKFTLLRELVRMAD